MGCMGCQGERQALGEACPQCEFEAFVRNHYFTGKMMGAGEFETETRYHGDKMRHHNVRLHGAGVVCGLKVRQHESADCSTRYVVVEPGSALDCCGHEILVTAPEIVDVGRHREVLRLANDGKLHTLELCVNYRECPTDDVPVLYDDCSCDDTQCAPNRILESFAFDVRVDPPLPDVQWMAGGAQGALVASSRHAATGFVAATTGGRVAIVDPSEPTRLALLDPARRAMVTAALQAPARALVASRDGQWVVVAQAPAGAASARLRVFRGDDLSEAFPDPARSAHWDLPAVTATTSLSLAAGDAGVVVYNGDNGRLYRWAKDATRGLSDATAPTAATQSWLLSAGLSRLVIEPGGTAAFAIGPLAAGKREIRRYALPATPAAAAVAPTLLSATDRPSALAWASLGAAAATLVVASADDKRAYLLNVGATPPTVLAQVDLDAAPVAVGVVGSGADVWLHALLDNNGVLFAQTARLTSSGTSLNVLTAAARLAGQGPDRAVVVGDDGRAGSVQVAALADGDCSDHLWKQLDACPSCDLPDCVVLATIANYAPGMPMLDLPAAADDGPVGRARIDNRTGRQLLASTATLQAWLQCLQLKGGVPGPAGPTGATGPAGPGIDKVTVTYVPPGPGSASFDPVTRELKLDIPVGEDGIDGTDGTNGTNGTIGTNGTDGRGIDQLDVQYVDPPQASAQLVPQLAPSINFTLRLRIPKGPKGDPGASVPGLDGEGLERDLVQIAEIGWKHDDWTGAFTPIVVGGGTPTAAGGGVMRCLWVRFTRPVTVADHGSLFGAPQAFRVWSPEAQGGMFASLEDQLKLLQVMQRPLHCECPLAGVLLPAKKGAAPATLEAMAAGFSDWWAFVLPAGIDAWLAERPRLRIALYGDFFLDEKGRAADVEFARAQLPSGDRPQGGQAGLQGGVFHSWLWVGKRDLPMGDAGDKKVDVNAAEREELARVPGVSDGHAQAIVDQRIADGPFGSLDDLRGRVPIADSLWALMRGSLRV